MVIGLVSLSTNHIVEREWSMSKEVELWLTVALPEFAKQAQAKEVINA